jgi:ABC-2 type transport system ATP-binding protein
VNIIETQGLGKRYRRTWALRDCTLAVPAGSVVALVGHNGAGKSTLLNLLVGLIEPTEGSVSVLGGEPAGSLAALDAVGYVAQESPLYQNLTVGETLRVVASLNRRWDQRRAETRLAELGIPRSRRVRRMSGGQQAQVALTLALARRPRLLVLDEPLAMLDPLARFDFMDTVMTAAYQDGLSAILSSHVLAELERVADHLILLSQGRVQVAGNVKSLLAGHRLLTGPAAETGKLPENLPVIHASAVGDRAGVLVSSGDQNAVPLGDWVGDLPEGWRQEPVSLEEMVIGYLREPDASVRSETAEVMA